jgi:hypothetical protein
MSEMEIIKGLIFTLREKLELANIAVDFFQEKGGEINSAYGEGRSDALKEIIDLLESIGSN